MLCSLCAEKVTFNRVNVCHILYIYHMDIFKQNIDP